MPWTPRTPLPPACVAALALLAGCGGAPEPQPPTPVERRQRALETLEDLWGLSEDPGGGAVADREVRSLDAREVHYLTLDGDAASLRWADVDSVEGVADLDLPRRPVTLLVYLRPGSPSERSAVDANAPRLAGDPGLARHYLRLARRPADARTRFLAALDVVRQLGAAPQPAPPAAEPEPVDPGPEPAVDPEPAPEAVDPADPEPADPEPSATSQPLAEEPPADEAERATWVKARLEQLKTWHAEGLLDDAEYAAEKQRLLERW